MRKIKQKSTNKKRGFSLAETALALAIVVAISVAATSLILSSSNVSTKGLIERRAYSHVSTLVDCFRYAEDEAALNQAFTVIDPNHTRTETIGRDRYFYEFDMQGYVLFAVVVFGEPDSFSVTAYVGETFIYGENNEIINEVICSFNGIVKGDV